MKIDKNTVNVYAYYEKYGKIIQCILRKNHIRFYCIAQEPHKFL